MSITSSGCCSQKVCRIHMAADSTDSTPLWAKNFMLKPAHSGCSGWGGMITAVRA
jgi:hypothetical protein